MNAWFLGRYVNISFLSCICFVVVVCRHDITDILLKVALHTITRFIFIGIFPEAYMVIVCSVFFSFCFYFLFSVCSYIAFELCFVVNICFSTQLYSFSSYTLYS